MTRFDGCEQHHKWPLLPFTRKSNYKSNDLHLLQNPTRSQREAAAQWSLTRGSSLERRANSEPATPDISAPHTTDPSRTKESVPPKHLASPFPAYAPVSVSLINRPNSLSNRDESLTDSQPPRPKKIPGQVVQLQVLAFFLSPVNVQQEHPEVDGTYNRWPRHNSKLLYLTTGGF